MQALSGLDQLVRRNLKDRIHLTLHFLGNVGVVRLGALESIIEPVVAGERSFSLEVRGVGAFPSMARPRTLWAGIEGAEVSWLLNLQTTLGRVLSSAGVVVEERRFTPHLTLARLRRSPDAAERSALARWQTEWSTPTLGIMEVAEVSLMRSELSSGPPRYTRLRSFRLQ